MNEQTSQAADEPQRARLRPFQLVLIFLSAFFGLAPEFNVATGASGPFLSDPRVYYDWATGRFFLTELKLGVVPASGAFDGTSDLLIAVSQTNNPTGLWNVFSINTTAAVPRPIPSSSSRRDPATMLTEPRTIEI